MPQFLAPSLNHYKISDVQTSEVGQSMWDHENLYAHRYGLTTFIRTISVKDMRYECGAGLKVRRSMHAT
jgi:hypothetical protein